MYSKIIVGYDGSAQADDALALGKLIAGATGASIIAVTVFQFDPMWGGHDIHFQDLDAELTEKLERAASSAGAEAQTVTTSSPARGLHELAEQLDVDLVVLGSAEHGKAGQIMAGSVAMSLLHGSPCSVAVAPHGYAAKAPDTIAEVAVGYDGSDEARIALAEAIDLARATDAPLKVVAVAEPSPVVIGKGAGSTTGRSELNKAIHEMMRERLDEALSSPPGDVRVEGTLVDGTPAESLAQIAREDGGVLVVGSRAYGPLRRVLLGSVSTELVRTAPCPVIVHPRPAKAPRPTSEPAQAGSAA
jgi:nucleotide-binding universal stress UspA family protein